MESIQKEKDLEVRNSVNENVNLKDKKSCKKKYLLLLLLVVILIVLCTCVVNRILHPRVLLGGQTIYIDYTQEGSCYLEEYNESDYELVIEEDLIPVQISEVPILDTEYFENAVNRYRNELLEIKTINNGKIYRRYEDISNFKYSIESLEYKSNATGKASMYIPEISTAISFAHPISTNDIRGIVYKAKSVGLEDESEGIDAEKVPDVIGYILGNDVYGVTIRYNKSKIETGNEKYITIARKNEVKIGKAFLYTDIGEGLNYYEIEIVSFTDPLIDLEYREEYAYHDRELIDNEIEKDRFYYSITDERLISKDIEASIPGMSGSPIIQDGKLIGFNGYNNYEYSIAVYAEQAYWDTIYKYLKEDYK